MKRGLVVLDHAEIPETEWRQRVAALQSRMSAAGIDVALVYGDVFRSDDIAYLTNLCIYWNEGMLAVPADGDPVFLTKLSPRVHPWMRRTSTVAEVHSGKSFGSLVAALLTGRPAAVVGLVDAPLWPAAVVEEVTAALPGWHVQPAHGMVRQLRTIPSERELALLWGGGGAVARAATAAVRDGLSTRERIATAELRVREAGFTDVLVDGTASSVAITGQYRNRWLHARRLAGAGRGVQESAGAIQAALRAAIDAATPGATTADLAAATTAHLAALPDHAAVDVDWIDHVDLATGGEYEPRSGDRALVGGSVVVITVDAVVPDTGHLAMADTVLVGARGAEVLTVTGVEREVSP